MPWSNGLTDWVEGDTAYISVVFSWKLQEAYQKAIWYKTQGYKVRAGGPGTFARKNYLSDVAELGGSVDALLHHNPNATIASRGCPVNCYFCIVAKMEGTEFQLLPEFIPKPILCDNNLSALPVDYQEYIIDKYKKYNVQLLDANSGFEPRSFDEDTYHRWKEINRGKWRFAYDETAEENEVHRMTCILKNETPKNKRVYVLIGNEPIQDCYRRIMQVIEWGCEPFVQPMIALNSMTKRYIVRFDWTKQELIDMARWVNKFRWRSTLWSEFDPGKEKDHRREPTRTLLRKNIKNYRSEETSEKPCWQALRTE